MGCGYSKKSSDRDDAFEYDNIYFEFQIRILEHEIRLISTALSGQIKQFDPLSRALILDLKCLLRYLGNVSSKVIQNSTAYCLYVYSDTRTKEDVEAENKTILEDIIRYCRRNDYKKHNVLLVGRAGSGKSSVINNMLKIIIGEFLPRAQAGSGNVPSNTLRLGR